jgi:hypothetical protein
MTKSIQAQIREVAKAPMMGSNEQDGERLFSAGKAVVLKWL